jgi:hypothetical protein
MDLRRGVEQRLNYSPGLLLAREGQAVADHRGVEEHLIRGRPFAALLRKLHVQVDSLGLHGVGAFCVHDQPDPGRGVELDDQLVGFRAPEPGREAELRRLLEDEPKLGLGDRQMLAGADEERDARPAPVVDLQAQSGVGLRR